MLYANFVTCWYLFSAPFLFFQAQIYLYWRLTLEMAYNCRITKKKTDALHTYFLGLRGHYSTDLLLNVYVASCGKGHVIL
jgi:hypothetical protein